MRIQVLGDLQDGFGEGHDVAGLGPPVGVPVVATGILLLMSQIEGDHGFLRKRTR